MAIPRSKTVLSKRVCCFFGRNNSKRISDQFWNVSLSFKGVNLRVILLTRERVATQLDTIKL